MCSSVGADMDTAMDLYGSDYAAHHMQHTTRQNRQAEAYRTIESEKKDYEYFGITGQYLELLQMAEDETLDQDMINDTLESVDWEFEEKADAYAKVMNSLDGTVAAIDKEIERLSQHKKRISNNIKGIKYNLERAMQLTGKTKFKTELFSFGIQKNPPAVVIDNEEDIPKEYYIPQDPKLDKTAIKKFLKDNEVSWAHLQQGESLRIR